MSWKQSRVETPKLYQRVIGRARDKDNKWNYYIGKYTAISTDSIKLKTDVTHPSMFDEDTLVRDTVWVSEWRPLRDQINVDEVYREYMEWVNDVSEQMDWKTTFGPEEIVNKICDIIEDKYE